MWFLRSLSCKVRNHRHSRSANTKIVLETLLLIPSHLWLDGNLCFTRLNHQCWILYFSDSPLFSASLCFIQGLRGILNQKKTFKTFIKCYQVSNQTLEEACIVFCHCIIKYINYRSEFLCASSNFLVLTYLKNIHLEGEPLKTTFRC